MKILNKDLIKKAKSVPKQVVKDKNKSKKDSDSDSEYFPSETDTSSDSDSDCESSSDEEIVSNVKKSEIKSKQNKPKIAPIVNDKKNKLDIKGDKMNNIIILSGYPNDAKYEDEYDSDYVTTSDSGSDVEEDEDISVSTSSTEIDEDESDDDNEDEEECQGKNVEENEKLITYLDNVTNKRKFKNSNLVKNKKKRMIL